jgi:hypothetical protein
MYFKNRANSSVFLFKPNASNTPFEAFGFSARGVKFILFVLKFSFTRALGGAGQA